MKKRIAFIGLFLITSWCAFADMGPKPTMRFILSYEDGLESEFVRLIQLQYNYKGDTIPADSLHEYTRRGPEGLNCLSPTDCRSLSYGYAEFQRLMLILKTDTLYSEVFTQSAFNSVYEVKISKNGLRVSNKTPWFFRDDNPYAYFRSLILTLLIELGALWLVLLLFRYPDKKRFLLAAFIANIVSLFVFWYGIMGLLNSVFGFFIGEVFVVAFETFFLWYFTKKAAPFGKTLLLVFFLNFLSMMAGGAFLFFNSMFGQDAVNWFL